MTLPCWRKDRPTQSLKPFLTQWIQTGCLSLTPQTSNIFLLLLRTGYISAQEFMTFMISRETENVDSAQEVEEAFQAITAGGERPYVTKEELYQVHRAVHSIYFTCPLQALSREQADYCIKRMKPYQGAGTVPGALDYKSFAHTLFST